MSAEGGANQSLWSSSGRGELTLLGFFARSRRSAWTALRAGLLRKLAGCTHREIGMRSRRHTSTAFRDVKDHVELSKSSLDYAAIAATLGNRVLKQMR